MDANRHKAQGRGVQDLFVREIFLRTPPPHADYPFNLPVVKNLERLEFHSPVVFFVGENGTGKSTLLEAIAVNCGFNAEGGSKNFCFATAETHSVLGEYLTVAKGVRHPQDGYFLRAESFYNVATEIDRLDESGGGGRKLKDSYGGKSLHVQSHGESFLALFLHRFGGRGLYLLDEPEAALSPMRQLALLRLMADSVKDGSQWLVSTHSPILMAFPGAQIFVIDEGEIRETPYQETEHYLLTKSFLNAPEPMLRELFRE
ncbi:MAG: AAA family ATPase [Peptococcaceae bacterium]|jgi:predicted ATPase|nr:AAA family ATPase [Peptococcaceae bacterium]